MRVSSTDFPSYFSKVAAVSLSLQLSVTCCICMFKALLFLPIDSCLLLLSCLPELIFLQVAIDGIHQPACQSFGVFQWGLPWSDKYGRGRLIIVVLQTTSHVTLESLMLYLFLLYALRRPQISQDINCTFQLRSFLNQKNGLCLAKNTEDAIIAVQDGTKEDLPHLSFA
jgi:hypothetical protein